MQADYQKANLSEIQNKSTRTVSLQVMKCTASSCEAMIQG